MWRLDGPQGFESRKIKYLIPQYTRGRGLEVGPGTEKCYEHFIGIDNGHHWGRGAADLMMEADDLSIFADDSLDFVFSSHVLEHMEDMQKTLNEWGRVIKPGGHLVLYVPSGNLYPLCGQPGANPDHKHDLFPGDIERMLEASPYLWTQLECEERSEEDEYSLFEVYKKGRCDKPDRSRRRACVCRFGGFGDMVQTALVFPRLKEQGFHVTVMTTPDGQNIIRHDPHVDDWFILDKDQVPNAELGAFWLAQARRFDRFINLSESVEGTLLAMPGRIQHTWNHATRHKMLNKNYHEFTAMLAGVPFKPCQLFYPSAEEKRAVRQTLDLSESDFNVVWALSGSSIHKWTPHQDAVIARILMEISDARIFLVGNDRCRILEAGWEDEPRVVKLSGEMSIRHTLTLAQLADLVIGPETGVLNAVAFSDTVNKIVFLSHSSKHNLTEHWTRTQALTPVDCDCYPCHQLHYHYYFCPPDPETSAAKCMQNISAAVIWEAVEKVARSYWRKK